MFSRLKEATLETSVSVVRIKHELAGVSYICGIRTSVSNVLHVAKDLK